MLKNLKYFPWFSAAVLTALILRLIFNGLTWLGTAALLLAICWFGLELVRWLIAMKEQASAHSHGSPGPPKDNESLTSLVFFLSEPREPKEETIRDCVATALNIDFQDNDPAAEYFVLQFTPPQFEDNPFQPIQHFMIRVPQGLFSVLASHAPYMAGPESFAKDSIRDKRLRSAVENHQAWLSVDLMNEGSGHDAETTALAYQVIGKLLAAMAGPDCLALYCPELRRCNEFDPSLIEVLAGGDPLSIFEEPTFEPIIEVSDDDPRMADAVAEALNRWPEFVAAFENRNTENQDKFIIKAEFTEGSASEYMWVAVSDLEDDLIRGVLMNDPHELLEVHRGATVEIEMSKLNDWIHPGPDDVPVGGFTLKVLTDEE